MSDYPMLISNKLHSFRNFEETKIQTLYSKSKKIRKKISWNCKKNERAGERMLSIVVPPARYYEKKVLLTLSRNSRR